MVKNLLKKTWAARQQLEKHVAQRGDSTGPMSVTFALVLTEALLKTSSKICSENLGLGPSVQAIRYDRRKNNTARTPQVCPAGQT
jgi:hypothetical protein